ncbi:MAG: dTDP-4-dehydrorhamnose reductase [Lachnospiraceae bacterium]|nr:dTDP-4-dehydrorhamnose reductase [Lachnospiraceae bacterium]
MKILVTGVNGQLGHDVVKELEKRGIEAVGVDIQEMDITDAGSVDRVIRQTAPDSVIHCAAYTAVDAAEDNEEACRRVNADGPRNIAKLCKELDIPMLHISSDYVFDGKGTQSWKPEDPCNPQSVYGLTKYEGEEAVRELLAKYFIVRITWTFGVNGKNFVKTMLNLSKNHTTVRVVNDQFGSPSYTYDLAKLLADMVLTDKYGTYHATNEGICSWYEFACAIYREAGLEMNVVPVTTEEYGAKAKRPANSRMDKEKLTENGFRRLPTWQDALSRYIKALRERGFFDQ